MGGTSATLDSNNVTMKYRFDPSYNTCLENDEHPLCRPSNPNDLYWEDWDGNSFDNAQLLRLFENIFTSNGYDVDAVLKNT